MNTYLIRGINKPRIGGRDMKIIYIPYKFKFKRDIYINLAIVAILLFLSIIVNDGKVIDVLNQVSLNPIYKGNETMSRVAFECNVVWGTEYLPQMLDILRDKNVKITFFIGGQWAEDNPELLKRMVREGHELGNHGYAHKHHSQLSLEENRREIQRTEQIVEEITGVKTVLFAPPYGEFNKTTLQAADSLGYKTIMWSIDTIDWRREGTDIILKRVLKNHHNGAFILMHPTEYTVEALPIMIDELRKKGYEVGRISDLLN